MIKILFLLFTFFSFNLFAEYFYNVNVANTSTYININTTSLKVACTDKTTCKISDSVCGKVLDGYGYYICYASYGDGTSSGDIFNYDVLVSPTCTNTQVLVNNVCVEVGSQGPCSDGNVVLPDGSCTTCEANSHYDTSISQCVPNCTVKSNSDILPSDKLDWIELPNYDVSQCSQYSIDTMHDVTYLSSTGDSTYCPYNKCFYNPYSPCDNSPDPISVKPAGYVFFGVIENDVSCSSYVDYKKYVASKTLDINTQCAQITVKYCYLLPASSDLNLTDALTPVPDSNGTISTAELNLSNNLNFNPDVNTSDPNVVNTVQNNVNNQILSNIKSNQDKQNQENSEFHSWFKDKFNNWQPVTDAQNQLSATNNVKTSTDAVKTSTDNVNNSINNANSNLGSKLDAINQSVKNLDSINQSIKDLNLSVDISSISDFINDNGNDNNSTGFVIADFNNSIDFSAISSFLSSFGTAWDNMKSDIDTVSTKGNDFISILESDKNGGFSLNLPHATVTSCPYVSQLDLSSIKSGWYIDINIDLCKPFSALYPIFYIIFSILFTVIIIGFAFKSIIRLV